MNFQQKLTRLRIARAIFDCCFIAGMYAITYFFAVPPYQLQVLAGTMFLESIWLLVAFQSEKQIIPFFSDETDGNTLYDGRTDFSNSFDWLGLAYMVWWIVFVTLFAIWGNHLNQWPQYLGLWISAGMFAVVAVLHTASYSRNRYVIQDTMLCIKEYSFFRPVTEIHLPIEAIQAIRIKAPYSPVRSRLVLTVDGVDRELWCTTNIIPLAAALSACRKKGE